VKCWREDLEELEMDDAWSWRPAEVRKSTNRRIVLADPLLDARHARLPRLAWWLALDVAVWSAVALLYAVQSAARAGTAGDGALMRITVSSLVSFAPCVPLTPLVALLARRFRFGEREWRRSTLAHLGGLAAFLVVAGPMMVAVELMLPWKQAAHQGAAIRMGVLYFLAPDTLIYVLIVAGVQVAAYARETRERAVAEARLRAELADARLHALSAQLQPHFLFNTLHAISALVRDEPKRAEALLARLSDLLRHALRATSSTDSSLGEELAFLEKYVDIQEARFGPRLQVTFDIAPGVLDLPVPCLLLQPLVENAIQHGIAHRRGRVEIAAYRVGARLSLSVRDDGVGFPADRPLREGIGLTATRARLRQYYGDDFGFSLENSPDGGVVCVISVPLRPRARESAAEVDVAVAGIVA
jgi:signal transduction histidine kinase